MSGPIFHDVFNLEMYLLNQVDLQLRLYRSKPSFCLMSGETSPDYEIVIEDIVLEACKIKVNPAVIYGQAQILQKISVSPYINMLEMAGVWTNHAGIGISRQDFSQGYALFCYQIQPSFGKQDAFLQLIKQGNIRLEAQFSTALTTTITCIVYSEIPALFQITNQRDIILE
ncbi:hypothetical protein KUTeg_001278 [Tegillarca granosa]|uniref:Uncharacterized protein n=1 Tax=Tegillarca granosa TaxID=220873 RepID=A0ABQ9FV74_TEGGR|nr:hypothetical protein KUTeg_001278 [Tegillarca granosa]